jgi:hypothetical protein
MHALYLRHNVLSFEQHLRIQICTLRLTLGAAEDQQTPNSTETAQLLVTVRALQKCSLKTSGQKRHWETLRAASGKRQQHH